MCYSPIFVKVGERFDNELGEFKKQIKSVSYYEDWDYTLPCGKCAECLTQKSMEWSYRIMLESKDYKDNCFITLTYADSPGSLKKEDYQKFLKRLRKKIGSFRYFLCGEYGSKGKRPHYHAIIFGWFPEDAEPIKDTDYYGSKILEEIWGLGFVSVGELTQYDAKYCAKYMQKLQKTDSAFVQPFVAMSTHPGLGYNQFIEHKDSYLSSDKIYFQGKYIKLPRYFLKKIFDSGDEDLNFDLLMNLKKYRSIRSELVPNTWENFENRKNKYKKLLKNVEK